MLHLVIHVCPRIPLHKGLQGPGRRPYPGLVHAPGGALYAGISGRAQATFDHRDLQRPTVAAEVTITAAEALGVDAAIIFADLLLPLEVMGLPFRFRREKVR